MLRSLFYSSFSALNTSFSTEKKTLPLTCLATKTLSVCEPSILIVVVVARVGLFTVRQIREWATYVFIYLLIFTLRYVIAPFRYLSRPSSVLRWRSAEMHFYWSKRFLCVLTESCVFIDLTLPSAAYCWYCLFYFRTKHFVYKSYRH